MIQSGGFLFRLFSSLVKTGLPLIKNVVKPLNLYMKLLLSTYIDTNKFVLKPKYDTDKSEWENKTPDVTDFVKKAKRTELEN